MEDDSLNSSWNSGLWIEVLSQCCIHTQHVETRVAPRGARAVQTVDNMTSDFK